MNIILEAKFLNDVNSLQAEITKRAKDRDSLKKLVTTWAKKRGTPVKVQVDVNPTLTIDVAGVYANDIDYEQDGTAKAPVNIIIQLPDENIKQNAFIIARQIVTAVDHEWIHVKQARGREFAMIRSVSKNLKTNKQRYLGNSDELDAYSNEVANEMELANLKKFGFDDLMQVSETLRLYVTHFGKDAPEVKKLITKAIKNYNKRDH